MNYFNSRMKALSLAPNDISIPKELYGGAPEAPSYFFFEADKSDNVIIHYRMLQGGPYTFKPSGIKKKVYTRTRLNPNSIVQDKNGVPIKYLSPKGSGQFPFFNAGIISKYQKAETIETLYLIEGEFKSFAAFKNGVDAVGLPSIHGFYGKKATYHTLHEDIIDLIDKCRVKNLVFLTDADTISVNWKEGKEMTARPISFKSAVKNLRQACNGLLKNQKFGLAHVYFGFLHQKFNPRCKGLDDLFENLPKEKTKITEALKGLKIKDNAYFKFIELDKNYNRKLHRLFGLDGVKSFYRTYSIFLKDKPFVFYNAVYITDGDEPRFLEHFDVHKYLRVGPDWFKRIQVPNKYGDLELELLPWKISEIQRDYQRYPGFIDKIATYDAFCNEPDWTANYSNIHNDCYNLCYPMPHVPEVKKWPTIYKFLKHLFQGEAQLRDGGSLMDIECALEGDPFTVALDWLTIVFRYPKQPLPVPVLVSPENNTGKSTFLKFISAVFGTNNAAILNNEQFKMKFNAHYITKFIIGIDESFLDVEKKAEKERLKQLVTSDTQYLENKGINLKKFPYYSKVIMASNDADSVMKIDEGEDRWFVVRVPKIPKGEKNPDLEKQMKAEIPGFLHFLANRIIAHPKKDRLWFEPKHFITDQYKVIVANSKTYIEKLLDSFMEDQFITYNLDKLEYDLIALTEKLNKLSKYRIDYSDIKRILKDKYSLTPANKTRRIKMPNGFSDFNDTPTINYESKSCRPVVFTRSHWTKQELDATINYNEVQTTFL